MLGAGQAGFTLATHLRKLSFSGDITLAGDEPYPPYQRPPLSKAYLCGGGALEDAWLAHPEALAAQGITLQTGDAAVAIDTSAKTVTFRSKRVQRFDKLALALGARARVPPLPGADLMGVHSLRGIDDARALSDALATAQRLVVIGGGYIGLEAAASVRKRGVEVTVLEAAPRILARSSSEPIARALAERHARAGVEIRTGATVAAILGADRAEAVALASGDALPADQVLIGVGAAPRTQLAQTAGLAVEGGISVDARARTSAPDIYAIGDCANFPSARYGTRLRLESVQNAIDQARALAAELCGRAQDYDPLPWFWSDQYELKLQIAGLSSFGDKSVIRADDQGGLSVVWLRAGRLACVEAINRAHDFMTARRLLSEPPVMAVDVLADVSRPLGDAVA
ncbi:MAG: NAD(P)/FAD-dependent oxidoreductase [Maricaulaceae bacterium]